MGPLESTAILTLTQMANEVGCPILKARTLVIEHGVPFDIVGKSWIFGLDAVKQFRAIHAEHVRRTRALGIRGRRARQPQPAT